MCETKQFVCITSIRIQKQFHYKQNGQLTVSIPNKCLPSQMTEGSENHVRKQPKRVVCGAFPSASTA